MIRFHINMLVLFIIRHFGLVYVCKHESNRYSWSRFVASITMHDRPGGPRKCQTCYKGVKMA